MSTVESKDGTRIGYETSGHGPALILIDGAMCSRAFGPMAKLAPLLAPQFTVYRYDRRGRGESGDTVPYAPAREIEDVDALIRVAGGKAHLLGLSSGAALALECAAAGLEVDRVVAFEPPYTEDDPNRAKHRPALERMIREGRRADAVKYFMRDMVGLPAVFLLLMRVMPGVWGKMKAVAPTLPYDAAVMSGYDVPRERLAAIRAPTLVLHGDRTQPRLVSAATAVAEAIPGAKHVTLAGQTHNVDAKVLSAAVLPFLTR
jgi:pimeloyl-ACP methyl ester carboxylesterase